VAKAGTGLTTGGTPEGVPFQIEIVLCGFVSLW
jgi:hypothetical protein